MIRYQNETSAPITDEKKVTQPNLYDDFLSALRAAQGKAEMLKERVGEAGREKAMRSKSGVGDLSVEELENMSEEEQEKAAMAEAQKRLAAMGINIKDLPKDGNISEAQAQQIAAQAMAKTRNGQMQAPKTNPRVAELQMKLADLGSEEGRLVLTIDDPLKAAAGEGRKLYDRQYRGRINGLEAQQKALVAQGYALSEKFTEEDRPRVEADNRKYQELTRQIWEAECDFYSKYIPMWRKAVLASMDFCKKTLLPLEKQRQEITGELYELTQSADFSQGDVYPLIAAAGYLEQAEKISEYDRYLKPSGE